MRKGAVSLLLAAASPFVMTGAGTADDLAAPEAKGAFSVDWSAEAIFAAGSNDFAPYYIASNNHGILTQSKDALLRVGASRAMSDSGRFSYGFGVDFLTGYTSTTDYYHYYPHATAEVPRPDGSFVVNPQHPSRIWLQQLYGEIRYRGVFLTVGMKQHSSVLLDSRLSSGDLVESGNARPIPEVRVGFHDFQNIPFTNGWVQIQGEISYGKMTDNKWLRDHYNYYDSHLNQGALYTYKRCYFRTKPSERFSAVVGMQVGGFFGGETTWYLNGRHDGEKKFSKGFKQFFKMFLPTDGGLDYYSGSSLGSWDIKFRYRLNDGSRVMAYLQKPWEDGSGVGFLNGFDGVWGLEYKAARPGYISGAVIEYIDFTNQSGPIHWDPDDNPGTTIVNRAEGCDNYYYNHEYNAYANYGMAIGTPFMVSPIYNTDGYLQFAANRLRGFHIGIEGQITPAVSYRMLGGYRKSYGSASVPFLSPREDTSFMLEATWRPAKFDGLAVKAQFGLDHGSLLGDNTGGLLSLSYSGKLLFGGKDKTLRMIAGY